MPVLSLDFVLHCYTCGRKQKSGPIKLTETFSAAVIGNAGFNGIQGCGTWFCFLSIGIISGSMWAQRAWGAFWNWDPKETFSLALWFVYLVYLHGRIARGWQAVEAPIALLPDLSS